MLDSVKTPVGSSNHCVQLLTGVHAGSDHAVNPALSDSAHNGCLLSCGVQHFDSSLQLSVIFSCRAHLTETATQDYAWPVTPSCYTGFLPFAHGGECSVRSGSLCTTASKAFKR